MNLEIDLRLAELLASRLCHDVVGPIGAVNNGMELLNDGELDRRTTPSSSSVKAPGRRPISCSTTAWPTAWPATAKAAI